MEQHRQETSGTETREQGEGVTKTVRQWREEKGLSAMQLAFMADVSLATIYLWEGMRSRPQRVMLRRLSEVLEVPENQIEVAPAKDWHAARGKEAVSNVS